MNHILLCTDGSQFSENSYHYGAWFAQQLNAAIKVLYVTDIRAQKSVESTNLSGSIGLGSSEQLLKQLVELEHEKAKLNHQKAKLILQNAGKVLATLSVSNLEIIHKTGFLVDCLDEFAAQPDLIILGKRGETANFAAGHLGANTERILRSLQRPCLITPAQFRPIERVLFAYDGSMSGQKILQFLQNNPIVTELELHIITVSKKPDDPQAIARLEAAKQGVEKVGFKLIVQLLTGHPETVIAEYGAAHGINLLLMGAYGHSRIRHLVIGSTTVQVLRKSQIPVLVFR